MKLKQIRRIVQVITLAFLLLLTAKPAYAANNVVVLALDTVAGFETKVEANGFKSNSAVSFKINQPGGSNFIVNVTSDGSGKAVALLDENMTRKAGTYNVELVGNERVGTSFKVFPAEIDSNLSDIYTDEDGLNADGMDSAVVTAKIVDEFNNPLAFHEIALVSNRTQDSIVKSANETDEKGLIKFIVSSKKSGLAVLTAVDESVQAVLKKDLKITFAKTRFSAIGGDPETVLLAQSGEAAGKFEIENLPASVVVNQTLNFKVRAVSAAGATIAAYGRTVIFSSTDTNAILPQSYTFQPSNQGQKTFDLGLTFRTTGTQKLVVQEQGNALIRGEKTVEVLAAAGVQNSGQVRITKPATGTYSVNTLEIAGEVSPNAKVKIFDNNQQIAEAQANLSGRFSYNTSLLADGQHIFYVESGGSSSAPVTVTIDSTPAQVEQVAVTKTNLAPGETTAISLRSDPDLSSVKLTVGELIVDLEADRENPGIYRGVITAPAKDGEYTLNVVITDKLGNTSSAIEVDKLRVDASLSQDLAATFSVPGKVTNVKAIPGDANITLAWSPVEAESGIAFYRIYYGTEASNLNLVANTPDAKTSFMVENLTNGFQYFFQITGVDTRGNEGDNRSTMIGSTPIIGGQRGRSPVLCDPGPCPPDLPTPYSTPEDGPEVLGMVLAAFASSLGIRFFRKK